MLQSRYRQPGLDHLCPAPRLADALGCPVGHRQCASRTTTADTSTSREDLGHQRGVTTTPDRLVEGGEGLGECSGTRDVDGGPLKGGHGDTVDGGDLVVVDRCRVQVPMPTDSAARRLPGDHMNLPDTRLQQRHRVHRRSGVVTDRQNRAVGAGGRRDRDRGQPV